MHKIVCLLLGGMLLITGGAHARDAKNSGRLVYANVSFLADVNEAKEAVRYPASHTLHWHTSQEMGVSDFGTVISSEFNIKAYLLPQEGVYVAPAEQHTLYVDRDKSGLFMLPAALYAGVSFAPFTLRTVAFKVTGGIGVGSAPFPLFFVYVSPRIDWEVIPPLLVLSAEFMATPQGITDAVDVRNAYKGITLLLGITPFTWGASLHVGYFDDSWLSEHTTQIQVHQYQSRGIIFGVTIPL